MADEPRDSSPLDSLDARLKAARAREQGLVERPGKAHAQGGAIALGFRVVTEVMAAIAVGALIGYGLDRWLGSAPWLMVVLLFLGGAAGIQNARRAAKEYEARERAAGDFRDDGKIER